MRRTSDSRWVLAVLAAIVVLAALLRVRYAAIPLERDEGEYAYVGGLMLDGVAPYERAYTMKWPGTHAMYALAMACFGRTPAAVRAGLGIANAIAIVLVYACVRRAASARAGLAAAAFYAVLSATSAVCGHAGHATHYVVLFALLGAWWLSSGRAPLRSAFLAGMAFALATTMKQAGAVFAVLGALVILAEIVHAPGGSDETDARSMHEHATRAPIGRALAWRRLAFYAIGALLPVGGMLGAIALGGSFDKFWFWTATYAREYAARNTWEYGWSALAATGWPLLRASLPIVLLALVGCALAWRDRGRRASAWVLVGFALSSIVATAATLEFREHYWVLLLPAVAAYAGIAVDEVARFAERRELAPRASAVLCVAITAVAVGYTLHRDRAVMFTLSPDAACRAMYGLNPFPEAQRIADYVRERSSPADEIAVVGSEPEIPFLAGRRSASGFLYTYGLMEDQPYALDMQEEMIAELEAKAPAYLVYVSSPLSWLVRPTSSTRIFEWTKSFVRASYELVGVIDLEGPDGTQYRFDQAAHGYRPETPEHVLVYRKKAPER